MIAPTSTLAPDSARQWVPFTLTPGNQVSFTATFDGKPLTAILDTGLSYSVLSRDYVRSAGIKVTQQGDATVIGGVVPIGWAATPMLSVGGLTRRGGEIAVAEVPALAAGGGQSIDLLVGPDLLAGYALDIDYANSRFRLLPSGQLPFRGASAPLRTSPPTNIYLTDGALGDHPLHPLMVDTGDGSMLTLSHRRLGRRRARSAADDHRDGLWPGRRGCHRPGDRSAFEAGRPCCSPDRGEDRAPGRLFRCGRRPGDGSAPGCCSAIACCSIPRQGGWCSRPARSPIGHRCDRPAGCCSASTRTGCAWSM